MEDGGRRRWVKHFPHMPTKRRLAAVVCSGKTLVVAGGKGGGWTKLTTVEVMDVDTLNWSTASSLPCPLFDASATVCGDRVYLVGGIVLKGHSTRTVLSCSLSALLQSLTGRTKDHQVWFTLASTPVFHSTTTTLNERLLAVGGVVRQHPQFNEPSLIFSNAIYLYNPVTNFWEITARFTTARHSCLVAVIPGNKLMVVGGAVGVWNFPRSIGTVEIGGVE